MEIIILKTVLFVFIFACGFIRLPMMKKCKNNINIVLKNPGVEKFKVFLAWLGMFLVPMLYIFTKLFNGFDINLPMWLRYISAVGLVLNAVFFYYIHRELSNNWSPYLEICENQKLIKTGVYSKIRHPMYTQSWLWVILQGVVSSNLFVFIFGIVTWGFLYFTRVFNEEEMMKEQFKDEYIEYMQQTGRLLPKF